MGSNSIWVILALIILLIIGIIALKKPGQPVTQPTASSTTQTASSSTQPANREILVNLAEQNSSSESGTAKLTDVDGKVTVTLELTGTPKDTPQPAHIHVGSCPNVGDVKYPLTSVVNGKSVTVIDTTLDKLLAQLPLGVNVHKSQAQAKEYVSCGDIKSG